MKELQKLQEKVESILGKIKTATEIVEGWTRTEDLVVESQRREYVLGYQEQILTFCQAFEELSPAIKGYGYILLTITDLTEIIRGFEDAISRYYPELEEA